jgi:hypothetical protein
MRAICVAAPASGWAAGVEEIVLGRASQLAREAVGGDAASFTISEPKEVGPGFEQRFEGRVHREDRTVAVRGRHWLGFAGAPREAFVCTVACVEPSPGASCEAVVAGVAPTGAWLGAPPPSLLARSMTFAASSPSVALGVVLFASLALATAVVVRRPRPRP